MAYDPFIGRSQAWLEDQLKLAQNDLAFGKTVTSVTAGDVSNGKQVQATAEKRIAILLAALRLRDPEKYPSVDVIRPTEALVSFR